MIEFHELTIVEKSGIFVSYVTYAIMMLLLALIARSQFEDRSLLETGIMVQGTIVTVSSGKRMSSGAIAYRLPNGVDCRDWTELGPNGEIHPGEPLTVAVDGTCGHPVSTKKRLAPWLYLSVFLGSALYPLFLTWRSYRKKRSVSATV